MRKKDEDTDLGDAAVVGFLPKQPQKPQFCPKPWGSEQLLWASHHSPGRSSRNLMGIIKKTPNPQPPQRDGIESINAFDSRNYFAVKTQLTDESWLCLGAFPPRGRHRHREGTQRLPALLPVGCWSWERHQGWNSAVVLGGKRPLIPSLFRWAAFHYPR